MNLLTDSWIPVRPLNGGGMRQITLQRLFCEESSWELCLPRDDMELATLQMIVSMAQTLFTPKDTTELKQRVMTPLALEVFHAGCASFIDWFRLDHPEFPFMQVRGVNAKELTPLDKLLAGVTGATNSCFVNEEGLGATLCQGCAAIALFNQAANAPSFGGGFKGSLRGGAPATTLVQGEHLRQTVWLNVLTAERLAKVMPWHEVTLSQRPTWVDVIIQGESIPVQNIGLLRGLFWQPAHIELVGNDDEGSCSCCGATSQKVYRGFKKAKFNYTLSGLWPHPHGARRVKITKGEREEKFVSFTTSAPGWTYLSRFVVQRTTDKGEGQEPAAVVLQAQGLIRGLRLAVGGYRNNQASILERRHELLFVNDGWSSDPSVLHALVSLAIGFRVALNKALFVFANGLREAKGAKIKGAGVAVHEIATEQFYRRSENVVLNALARVDFNDPTLQLKAMEDELYRLVQDLFNHAVKPYHNDPELVRTTAVSRRILFKHLSTLKSAQVERSDNGTNG